VSGRRVDVALLARTEEKLVEAAKEAGECGGGEGDGQSHFASTWDTDLAMELFPVWTSRGLLTDKLMDVEHLVDGVAGLLQLGATAAAPSVAITPRRPF
jgi:hypothetical protein